MSKLDNYCALATWLWMAISLTENFSVSGIGIQHWQAFLGCKEVLACRVNYIIAIDGRRALPWNHSLWNRTRHSWRCILHESLENSTGSNCLRWWLLCHCAEAPASLAYQCTSAVVYIAAYSELQSNGVNDGGRYNRVTRFAWLNRRCFKVYYAVYFIGIRCSRSE